MPLIFDCSLLAVGSVWMYFALTRYPLWKGYSISGGLIPLVVSTIMVALLLFRIIARLRKEKIDRKYFKRTFREIDWRCMLPVLIGTGVVIGTKLIGMFISLTIMLFFWLRFLSKCMWLRSFIMTVIVMAVIYGIFRAWLAVPLPKGLLGLI